jgi:hypothetical protein
MVFTFSLSQSDYIKRIPLKFFFVFLIKKVVRFICSVLFGNPFSPMYNFLSLSLYLFQWAYNCYAYLIPLPSGLYKMFLYIIIQTSLELLFNLEKYFFLQSFQKSFKARKFVQLFPSTFYITKHLPVNWCMPVVLVKEYF